jgi:hypothetical protein
MFALTLEGLSGTTIDYAAGPCGFSAGLSAEGGDVTRPGRCNT